ncbi:FAD:protein FMN transferase [Cupriavidus plantarum]|uniref:FAD:protein FMN transferase n=1 Tax=Cupriavidus plantarum TaxID=942865 RepID=UPI001B1F633D|nr:FAD:protein FMN transferase [Cupriavidus plantarum]CAG2146244.1 FAD:protein FMN transferase [Cupriavidus plantarum]SMR86160.1 thiamine biosynthesis lipoprotein [Cupriavidus plantarum]
MNRVLIPLTLREPPLPAVGARAWQWAGETMGTTWSVAAELPPPSDPSSLGEGIRTVFDDVIAQMSNWSTDSDVSRYNRAAAGEWIVLPEDAFTVLTTALRIARESGGAYDPSAGALVDLWGFGPAGRREAAPAPDAIARLREQCGWLRLRTDDARRAVLQPGGASLDFCAIAKGFAVDTVSRYLTAAGVTSHLVEIGGELRGHGVKADGMPWWVELESPVAETEPEGARTLVALCGLSVATSGDYRRYFEQDGRRYAHTIDPRTGYPATHALASVTVLHEDAMMADAWSTALTVLGPDAGCQAADRQALAARFLVRTPHGFDEHLSAAFAAMMQ